MLSDWFFLYHKVWIITIIYGTKQVAGEKHDKDEKAPAFEGLFFNYFSIGKWYVTKIF